MFMSDEAHFWPVNKQNSWYWSTENLFQLHKKSLHRLKVTVWYARLSSVIIRQLIFQDRWVHTTSNTAVRYRRMVSTFLKQRLVWFPQIMYFHQDGTKNHTACVSITALKEFFLNYVISKNWDIVWLDLLICLHMTFSSVFAQEQGVY